MTEQLVLIYAVMLTAWVVPHVINEHFIPWAKGRGGLWPFNRSRRCVHGDYNEVCARHYGVYGS